MRVLIVAAHAGHMRNAEWVIRELAARGHRLTVATRRSGRADDDGILGQLVADGMIDVTAPPATAARDLIGVGVRRLLDALHHLESPFADAPLPRARAAAAASPFGPLLVRLLARRPGARRIVARHLERTDVLLGPSATVRRFLSGHRPDVVIVTPLVDLGSPQAAVVRAAAAAGVPTVLLIASWDNLTAKGRIRAVPDLVLLWNEAQRREAVELHGIPDRHIAVCGAWPFDHWFGTDGGAAPGPGPEVGEAGRPRAVLYLGSSASIAPDEGEALPEWVTAVRAGRLVDRPIVIRPHPLNPLCPELRAQLLLQPGVRISPTGVELPGSGGARVEYMRTIRESAVVVGVNTSGLIEAAVAGKPVLTVLLPRFDAGQRSSLHFRYLLPEVGGPLEIAGSLDEHRRQLEAVLDGESAETAARRAEFVSRFVRPLGLEVAGSLRVADEIERLAAPRAGLTHRVGSGRPG